MIICFAGKRRSGKDTASDVLIKKFGFSKISLAHAVKTLCSDVFLEHSDKFFDDMLKDMKIPLFNLTTINYVSLESSMKRLYGYTYTTPYDLMEKLSKVNLDTPRAILQIIGTDLIRTCLGNDIWLEIATKELSSFNDYVISDTRFRNEREFFKSKGAIVCLIKRPELSNKDSHISENDLGEEDEYSIIIRNDSKKESFEEQVELWTSLRRKIYG